jgi:hypothetical protein
VQWIHKNTLSLSGLQRNKNFTNAMAMSVVIYSEVMNIMIETLKIDTTTRAL